MLSTLEKVLFLQQVPLLGDAPTEALAHLAKVARVNQVQGGHDLWRRGDARIAVYFIVEGEVAVDDGYGNYDARRGPGSDLGASALVGPNGERETSCVTLRPTVLLEVPRDEFFEVLREHPEIGRALLASLGTRLDDTRRLDC